MKTLASMLRILAILTAVLGLVKSVTVTMPESAVNTTVGANITLPCLYTPASIPDMIQWNFYGSDLQSLGIYISRHGTPYYFTQFKNRIQVANKTGNATLTIFNMQPSNSGVYRCSVYKFTDATASEGEKSVSVSVQVPPSKPLCSFGSSLHPKVEIGHLITLACISETGLPKPAYKWYKLTGDKPQPVTELYNPSSGRLVLGNLSQFEEGYYQCTAINSLGNSSCYIDLTTKHSEGGIIAGALIASILAAALICIIVWILISREKKKRQKEKPIAKEMQPMATTKAEYATVPSQASVPLAAIPPNKDPNETGEHESPEEAQVAILPENETQEMGHQPVS
ncbi:V-set and immunoglobulin domain-containing protein 1 [Notechis scutatus]|uniref:V-set and immunoglobulin domain-containing protein 1 n=1 Tax=Notechis scutatus TaxID=8663 RepID=UPI000E785873|nr:V-set and immunoglobulin domain-containing protein 1 [Notechis scutatus]